jgi:hypothetical protein
MATSRELIFKPADVRVSIRCGKCKGEIVLSLDEYKIPNQCPSCAEGWTEELRAAVHNLKGALKAAVEYPVVLRAQETMPQR